MGRERSTRQSLRRIVTMSALLLVAMVTSGCTVFNGGGWLRSANMTALNEKATFGINGKCQEGQFEVGDLGLFQGAALADGQFQYDDHAFAIGGVGVQFHGEVTESSGTVPSPLVFVGLTCQEAKRFLDGGADSGGTVMFLGTYRPQDRALAKKWTACSKDPAESECTFSGQITDLGEPGVQAGDLFSIKLETGPFAGYTNSGPLEGGNIQVD